MPMKLTNYLTRFSLIYSKDIKDIIILSTSFTQSINRNNQSIN